MQKIHPIINRLRLASPPVSASTLTDTPRRAAGLIIGLAHAVHHGDQTAGEGQP